MNYTGNDQIDKGEVNNEENMTVPNMSLSVQEIILRYTQGRPVAINNNLLYTGEEEELLYPDTRMMDLTEQEEALEQARESVRKTDAKLKKQADDAQRLYDQKRLAREQQKGGGNKGEKTGENKGEPDEDIS